MKLPVRRAFLPRSILKAMVSRLAKVSSIFHFLELSSIIVSMT